MDTLERFVLGVQTRMLALAASGDLSAASLATDVVIAATFVDPACIDEMDEPMEDERLYLAVWDYCHWSTYRGPETLPRPAWLRFTLDEDRG